MPSPCALIINPTAGSFSQKTFDHIIDHLQRLGLAPQLCLTNGPDDAARYAARLCAAESSPFIIAGGGDGTVNGVINGVVPGRAELAVLPLGTANVLARELGIFSLDDALARIARRETRPLSVVELEGEGVKRCFVLMAGAGFDGAVVESVRHQEKRLFHQGAYILSAIRRLLAWETAKFKVTMDGDTLECHSVVVCNAANYGGRFRLAPDADMFRPDLQVVCIEEGGRGVYLRGALALAAGKGLPAGFQTRTATEIRIEGDKPVQLDGDYFCRAPVRIKVVGDFVRLVV